jgi:hypothetical protein
MVKKKKPIPPLKKQQAESKKPASVGAVPKPQTGGARVNIRAKAAEAKTVTFVFGRINYIIMVGGLLLLALGYVLMIGGGSDDPNVFNPAIFNAQRLTVSPILIMLGFAAQVVAILIKPKETQ